MDESSRAVDAVRLIWENGIGPDFVDDPRTPEFASAALAELIGRRRRISGILEEALQGADMGASQLAVDDTHGLLEVVQNADDQGASLIRFGMRTVAGSTQLLAAHNGETIDIRDVVAMLFAFVSTKRDDPEVTGKFGVGLKTLSRIASRLDVHCHPYHFSIHGSEIYEISPVDVDRFYSASSDDTLLVLWLKDDAYRYAVEEWASSWSAHDMLFLRSLKRFSWISLQDGLLEFTRELVERSSDADSAWQAGLRLKHIRATRLADVSEEREWIRFDAEAPVPGDLERALKATGDTTTVSVAVPSKPVNSVLYSGLPTKILLRLPYAIGAAFDPDTARGKIQQTKWNGWLWQRVTDLASSVAAHLLEALPSIAWQLIPASTETEVPADLWVQQRVEEMSALISKTVCDEDQKILLDGISVHLSEVSYEHKSLSGLLTISDYDVLAPAQHRLTQDARDEDGRWRLVLEGLEIGKCLDVSDALSLLAPYAKRPVDRNPAWFVQITAEALKADLKSELENYPCILVDGPMELSTPGANGPLYSAEPVHNVLASSLGLVRNLHNALLDGGTEGELVLDWLRTLGKLWHGADAMTVLEAIVHRGLAEPLELSDDDLIDLRDCIDEVEEPDEELLLRVGDSVLIDAYQWVDGRREYSKELARSVYLPPTISGGTEPWNKAAARTPGLKWAAPRYGRLLDPGDRHSRKSGTRRTFGRLGALTMFRLELQENYHRIDHPVPPSQTIAFHKFPHVTEYLRQDYISPDLESVVEDICEDTPTARFERGLALLEVLRRHWMRTLQRRQHCVAYRFYYQYRRLGDVPCTWLSKLADSPWLQSEDGRPARPRELTVRSILTEGLFGDEKSMFATGVTDDIERGLLSALGFQERPSASQVVDILRGVRDTGERIEWGAMRRYYAYLATLCPDSSDKVRQDTKIDDMTVGQIRGSFGIKSGAPGLIAQNGFWLAPSAVFKGRPIFGRRRRFVPDSDSYERLWNVLAIREPRVSDCVAVLEEIAHDGDAFTDASILTDTYRHLNDILSSAKTKDRILLMSVPLWTGSEWVTERPVYYIADETALRSLKSSHNVWEPPCSLEGMDAFVEALGVTLIPSESCAPTGIGLDAHSRGSSLRREFKADVEALKGFLAKNHPGAYRSIEFSWTALSDASLAVSPDLGLDISLLDGEQEFATTNAYIAHDSITIYLSDEDLLHDYNAGARVISQRFGSLENRQIVRLAWANPDVMGLGNSASIALADDLPEEENPLADLKAAIDQNMGLFVNSQRPTRKKKAGGPGKPPPAPRRLKSLEHMAIANVEIINPHASVGKRRKTQKTPPVQTPPDGPRVGERIPNGSAPMSYKPQEREKLALQVLKGVVRNNKAILKDFTHIAGLGADAGDDLGRLFEIKAHGGEIPDSVSVQPSQIKAAEKNPKDFYLAIVGGLEEGYETVVKLFARPLETLDWERGTTFKLSGIRSKQAIEVRINTG